MSDKPHDYGIDCVKVLAIVLVIVHHVIDFGFTMSDSAGAPLRIFWYILREIACTCVNLFAIATGFLCVKSAKPGRHLSALWWQVFFTGLVLTAAFSLAGVPVSGWNWFRAFFPVMTGEYWYFTAYFLLALFMPVINPGILLMKKQQFLRLLVLLFLLLSVSSIFVNSDPFVLKSGYSFAWLLVMYLAGAYWRLHVPKHPPKLLLVLLLALCSLSFLIPSTGKRIFAGDLGLWFGQLNHVRYISPFNIGLSLAIFGLCRHIAVRRTFTTKALSAISASSLGMYLWLVHPVFWHTFWRPTLGVIVISELDKFLLHIAVVTVTSFGAAFALEFLRKKLFSLIRHTFGILRQQD